MPWVWSVLLACICSNNFECVKQEGESRQRRGLKGKIRYKFPCSHSGTRGNADTELFFCRDHMLFLCFNYHFYPVIRVISLSGWGDSKSCDLLFSVCDSTTAYRRPRCRASTPRWSWDSALIWVTNKDAIKHWMQSALFECPQSTRLISDKCAFIYYSPLNYCRFRARRIPCLKLNKKPPPLYFCKRVISLWWLEGLTDAEWMRWVSWKLTDRAGTGAEEIISYWDKDTYKYNSSSTSSRCQQVPSLSLLLIEARRDNSWTTICC